MHFLKGKAMSPRRRRDRREPYSSWVETPFTRRIRAELERQDITPAEFARLFGSQSSIVSRWMQGNRPNTDSILQIAEVLGMDVLDLMVLAEHLPESVRHERPARLNDIIAKLDAIRWTEARYDNVELIVDSAGEKSRLEQLREEEAEEEEDDPEEERRSA
jgi:transcriptional regulator with XRE-family HTH domain